MSTLVLPTPNPDEPALSPPNPTASADQVCWLNGRFQALAHASVSVLDRGFLFGDGIYEVVPVYQGVAFRWAEHRARLRRSLAKVRLADPYTDEEWRALIDALIERHSWPDQFVYLQITRGVAKRDHAFPNPPVPPTVFAMTSPLVLPSAALLEHGVSAISLPDERWLHCDIKSVALLGNVLARQAAVDASAQECVMFRDGYLTEGSSSNLWVVRNETVYAPPRDHRILEGIRYGLMAELCEAQGLEFVVAPITRDDVIAADELLLSSATKEILPITRLDGQAVGHGASAGQPGPIGKRLLCAYQDAKRAAIARAATNQSAQS